MPIDKTYAKKVYDSLRDDVEGFDKDEATFYKLIETDKNYLKNVHLTLKDVYGDDFDKDESMFESALGLKKKEPSTTTSSTGYKSALSGIKGTSTPPTESGIKKSQGVSQSPLKTAATTTQLDFTRPQPRISAEEQQAGEIAATKGYVGQETEGTQLDVILANQKAQNIPLEKQMTSKEMTEQLDLLMPSTRGVESNQAFDAIFKKEGRENELVGVNETEFKKFLSATGVTDKYNNARMEFDMSDKERYSVIQNFNQSIAGKSVQDLNIVKARLNSNPAYQYVKDLQDQSAAIEEQIMGMDIPNGIVLAAKSPEERAQFNDLMRQYDIISQEIEITAERSGVAKDLQDLESFESDYSSSLLRSRALVDRFPNILKEQKLQEKADAEYEDRRARFKKGDLSVLPTSAMYVGASAINALNRNFYNSLASLIDNFGKLNDNTYSLGDWASKGLTELADNAIITPHKEFSKSGYNIDGYIVTKDKSGAISVFDKDFTPVQVDPNLAKKFNDEYDKKQSTGAEKETMYDFFSLAPQLADQFVTMYSLVGGGRLAQVGLQSLTKRAISQNTGMTAASYLMTYEDYKKTGIENGLSDTDAHLFASISAMTTSLLEGISPNENLIPKGQAAKALEAFTASVGAPIKTRMKAVANALAVEPTKEIIQEITQLGGDILTETGANAALGKDVFDAATDMDEIRNTAVLTFATTALAQLPTSGMFDTKNKKEWWQWASKDVDKLIAQVQEDVKNGLYTEEKAQIIVEKAKAWAATQGKIPAGTEDVKRAQITPLLMEKVELLATSKDLDKVFQDKINKRIDAIDKEIVSIMNKPVSEFTTEVQETTTEETDEQRGIEEPISAGTDVLETGVGMAAEPGKERVAGENIQAEEVPQTPLEKQKAEIEKRRQEELADNGLKGLNEKARNEFINYINTKYDAELAALEKPQVPEVVSEKVTEVTAPAIEVTPQAGSVGVGEYVKLKSGTSDIGNGLSIVKEIGNDEKLPKVKIVLKDTNGKSVSQFDGFITSDNTIHPLSILTFEGNRRKGYATKIYDYLKEQGYDVTESKSITEEGKLFRKGREGKAVEQSLKETPTAEAKPTEAAKVEPVKEAAKPTKTERKAIAEAKIDDLAAKAKEFLRNKNLPEGTQVSGVSQNKVIDILASTVKALVNSGIEIAEAIKQVREYFEQDFDTSGIKDYEIAQAIARDELTDVAKENGFSSYREAVFAVNSYVRPVSEEDVITKDEIEKAAKEKAKKKAKSSEKKGYTGRKKVSKFYKTALAYVQNTPTRLQDFLKANPLSYGVVTNAESIKKAIDFIEENGFEETLKDFLTKQIKTDGEFEKIIFVGYLLRGGLSEAFTDISKSMNGVTDADEIAALKKEADRIFNDMKAVTTLLAEGYFPSFGRAIQAGALFAQDLSTEDGAIFHFTKLTEQAAAKAREVNKQEATEQVNTVKEVVEEGTAKAAKQVTEYIVKSKDVQARNATKLSKARKAASDAREKLKAALAKYKILGIANDPWEQAKNDVATIKALTDYVAAQLKYKSVQAGQVIKEVAALLGINPRYIPKVDIQEIMDAAKVQAEKDMTFDEITSATTPKGVAYAERVGKELSNDPSAINKTVESIIQDYYMGNQTLDEIIDMVKQRFDVTDAQAITIAKQIQVSINDNITKALEKQLDRKIKQLNDKRLKEEGKKPPKERKPVKSLYDIMAQAQVMGVLDADSVQAILEELYNVPTVTPEDIQFVKDTYAKINNTGDLTRKAQLIADLHKRFAGKNPVLFYDVYNSYWYSAVLSGPSTTDVNAAYGFVVTALAIQDVISGAFINSVKIIADKFKGKQNPSSVALEARLIFDSMWRTIFQTGTLNIDAIKRGSLFKMESLPLYESFQNLVSTLKRGPQAFNEELRNTEVSAKDNAYLKDYKPQGLGKLISPLVWIDKKTGIFSFLPKYVPRAINAVDIFFGTALKNLNLAQTLKTYYVQQGLSGKDLAQAIRSDLNKSPELLLAARELAANDRLNIDLEIKQENGEFVVYDTGKKQKSFKTKSSANKYMTELSYQGDKYQKGVVDYLNATLPPDVIDATRRIAAQYVCTGDVEGARSKWFYNNIILNIRKATMDWADSKEQSKFTRAIKFATSRVVEFMKFPLNFNNLAIAYTPALAFMRAKYTGDEASLYAQVYKDKAQQRFLTGFAAFMALTTPTLLSMLVLKSPDDEEEENKEDLKRRQELADKFFKDTGEKIDIDNPLFNLPKDGELTGSLSFLPANTKKFLKENNLAVPFRRWNAKLNIWEDYTISPLVYNLTMAASLADYVKYVINDKTKFNSVAQRAKEWQNVASYFAGNLVQTFVNAAGVKSQNQLLLTLNSNNYERKINAAVDMLFSPVQSTPALLRQLSDGLDMRLKERVEITDKPFEYVASKTIPLGGLFYTGRKKHDMFGDEIAYLTGADRGFVLKHLFAVTQKDYEKKRTELGQFLNINGYSKYRDMITEYDKKNKEIIDIKNPTVEINGIAYTNYLDKGFTDDEMYEIGLAAAKRAKKVLLDNKVLLQEIGNATNLEEIPLISADYKIPFTEAIDKIYDTIFEEEWKSALAKKEYVNRIGKEIYKAEEVYSKVIPIELKAILVTTKVEKKIPLKAKIPIEYQDIE